MITILLITFFFLLLVAFVSSRNGKSEKVIYFTLCIYLILLAGLRGEGVDKDYRNYVSLFLEPDLFVEPSYVFVSYIIKIFTKDSVYLFLCFAILGVSTKFIAVRHITKLWFLSILVYFSNFYILHDLTQIRAGVASGLLLLCVKPIIDKDLKKFLLIAFLAVSFHYSALLILPLWFLNSKPQKKILIFSIPLAYLIYFSKVNLILFLPIPGIQEKLEIYKQLQEVDGDVWNVINVFNMLFLVRIAIFYFIVFKYELIVIYNRYTPILLKIYCIALISFPIFATMPIAAFRISEFLGIVEIILIPLIYYTIKPSLFSKFIIMIIATSIILIVLFYTKILIY